MPPRVKSGTLAYLGDMTVFPQSSSRSGAMLSSLRAQRRRMFEDPIGYDEEIWVCFNADVRCVGAN